MTYTFSDLIDHLKGVVRGAYIIFIYIYLFEKMHRKDNKKITNRNATVKFHRSS